MNPIFNTKVFFYDYFPHITPMRMKVDFGLGIYPQSVIRNEIQNVIKREYELLLAQHNLMHVGIYQDISDEFDKNFYNELKTNSIYKFHNTNTWSFLDNLMPFDKIDDDKKNANFNTRLVVALGYGLTRDKNNRVNLKNALSSLLIKDMEKLTGRELLYLTKIK